MPVVPLILMRILRVPQTSPFLVPFKNGFYADPWCCLHITLKRLKVALIKIVCVNEAVQNGCVEKMPMELTVGVERVNLG